MSDPVPAGTDQALAAARAEQVAGWRGGQPISVEQLLRKYPTLGADPEAVLVLICGEAGLRAERGEVPDVARYGRRFPQLADRLDARFAALVTTPAGVPGVGTPPVGASTPRTGVATTPLNAAAGDPKGSAADTGVAVPGYEILGELGRGGMGVVYTARQAGLNRLVALKMVLASPYASPTDRARFQVEAEAVAALEHPHVVRVFAFGEHAGQPYLAMEFLPGGTLADRVKAGGGLPPREAADLVAKLAGAVAHAHARGVVHRDIKPGNVLLGADGQPRLTDFGLAKFGRSDLTGTNAVLGTPAYMSPEQAGGKPKEVGTPADVYALGAVLYCLLTGRAPFRGPTAAAVLHQVLTADPERPRGLNPAVPRDLETVCLKCLEKNPARRYPTAQAVGDDLTRFLAGEPITARPAGAAERAVKWVRRHPVLVGLAALGGLTVAASITALAVSWQNAELRGRTERESRLREAADARLQREQMEAAAAEAERKRADAKRQDDERRQARELEREREYARRAQFAATVGRVSEIWEPDPFRGLAILDDPAACPPDVRDFTWHLLRRLCNRNYLTVPSPGGSAVAFSRDGRTVALGGRGKETVVRLLDPETGAERGRLAGHTGTVLAVAYSPDGKFLASAGLDGTVRLWDAATGEPGRVLDGFKDGVRALAFSPDGRRLAAGCGSGAIIPHPSPIKVWELPGDRAPVVLDGHGADIWSLTFCPNAGVLASASEDKTVRLWNLATGAERASLPHDDRATSVACAPDGKTIAVGTSAGVIRVWDAATGSELRKWNAKAAGVYALAFSPGGTQLATAHDGGGAGTQVKLWDAGSGVAGLSLDAARARLTALAYSPDGRTLVAADDAGTVRFWRVRPATESAVLNAHPLVGNSLAYSPTEDVLATGGAGGLLGVSGEVKLWSPGATKPFATLSGHDGRVLCLAYSPDGRRLASGSSDGVVLVWDTATRTVRTTLRGHRGEVRTAAFSPDGRVLATGGKDDSVRLWDPEAGGEPRTLTGHTHDVMAVAFAPAGGVLASAGHDGSIRLWDAASGGPRGVWDNGRGVLALGYSTDGRTLVAASADGTVQFRDATTGKAWASPRGHNGWVYSLAFSPDGKTLATAGLDGRVKLWDTLTAAELTGLPPIHTEWKGVGFSRDSRSLAALSRDGTVWLWR